TVFDDLTADLRAGTVTPVLIGTAEKGNGVLRLLKTIRHDAPDIAATRARLALEEGNETVAQVMKAVHTAHRGELSVARILTGALSDGAEVFGAGVAARVSGIYRLLGREQTKLPTAQAGDTVALGKLDGIATGQALTTAKGGAPSPVELSTPHP